MNSRMQLGRHRRAPTAGADARRRPTTPTVGDIVDVVTLPSNLLWKYMGMPRFQTSL